MLSLIYMVEMESFSCLYCLCLQVQYTLPAIILTGILVVIGTSLLCNALYFDHPRNTRITVAVYTKHPDVQPVQRALIRTLCMSTPLGMANVALGSLQTFGNLLQFPSPLTT